MKYLDELLISRQILVKAAVEWRSTEPAQVIRNLGTKRPAPRSAFPLIPREEHLEADFNWKFGRAGSITIETKVDRFW